MVREQHLWAKGAVQLQIQFLFETVDIKFNNT